TFVGPDPSVMERMGDKARTREEAQAVGLPVLPGSDGPVRDLAEAAAAADRIGYPVLLKAVAGGGGRGMRRVEAPGDLAAAFDVAEREEESAFGDGGLSDVRALDGARHVELHDLAIWLCDWQT